MFRDSWLCQVAPPAPSYCAYTLVRTCACTLIGSHWARFYAPSRWVPKIGAPFTIGFPWFPSNQTWRLEIPSFLSWFDERKINSPPAVAPVSSTALPFKSNGWYKELGKQDMANKGQRLCQICSRHVFSYEPYNYSPIWL